MTDSTISEFQITENWDINISHKTAFHCLFMKPSGEQDISAYITNHVWLPAFAEPLQKQLFLPSLLKKISAQLTTQ